MLDVILSFIMGFLIPFIARRFGKVLPATTGTILFQLPHLPRFPKVHNPLQHAQFNTQWKRLLVHATIMGALMSGLCAITYYLPSHLQLYALFFAWIILCAAETDKRYYILPDCLTIPLMLVGFLFATQTNAISPSQSVYGAFFAYFITVFSVFLLSFNKHPIFGAGDSKMAIALGTWLGVQGLNYTILLSFFLFVLYSFLTQKKSGAYGPALGLAGLFVFFILYLK